MARRRRKRPFQDIRAFLQRRAASIAGFFAHIAEGVRGHLPRKRKSRGQRAASQPAPAAPVKEKAPLWPMISLACAGVLAAAFFCFAATRPDPRTQVTLLVDGVEADFSLQGETVQALLDAAGVTLHAGDSVSPDLDAALEPNMRVEVTRAYPVAVQSGGQVQVLHMSEGTVGEALSKAKVSYSSGDELSQLPFADVEPGMRITHTAVDISYEVSYKTLEYDEVVIKDEDEYEDYKKVEVEGVNGKKQVTQRITVKDGIEVSREVADQVVISPAVDEVVRIGTKIKYQTNFEGEFRRWKEAPVAGENGWVEMTVDKITAYCTGTRTATGTTPKLGTIAVNTYYIPYGSEIYIKGYGYGTAQDTGAFRNYVNDEGEPMNQLDIWLNTRSEAMRWGTKYDVTILVRK